MIPCSAPKVQTWSLGDLLHGFWTAKQLADFPEDVYCSSAANLLGARELGA